MHGRTPRASACDSAKMVESWIPALALASAEAMRSKVGPARVARRHMALASQEWGQATRVRQGAAQSLASVLLGPIVTFANPPMCVVQRTLAPLAVHLATVANVVAPVALAGPTNSVVKILRPIVIAESCPRAGHYRELVHG